MPRRDQHGSVELAHVGGPIVDVYRSDDDQVWVVDIDTTPFGDTDQRPNSSGAPRIRVWLNEALIEDENGAALDLSPLSRPAR